MSTLRSFLGLLFITALPVIFYNYMANIGIIRYFQEEFLPLGSIEQPNSNMSGAIPVVVCGSTARIAEVVKAKLQPEYEVIHTLHTLEAAVAALPALLRGEDPTPGKAYVVGTRNYKHPAKAVLAGGAFDENAISIMREACKGSQVPWLRSDLSKPTPFILTGRSFGAAVGERVKARLNELVKDGKMQGDGIYWY